MNDNPFASPTVELGDSPPEAYQTGEDGDLQFAGFIPRLLALSVDGLLLYVISILEGLVLVLKEKVLGLPNSEFQVLGLGLIAIATPVVYFWLLESSALQGSLGKRVMGVRVISYQRQRIGLIRSLVRQLVKLLILPLGVGVIPVLFRQDHRAMHDVFSQTCVVRR